MTARSRSQIGSGMADMGGLLRMQRGSPSSPGRLNRAPKYVY
jgi:hypothetical protein